MGSIINIKTNPKSWYIDETKTLSLKATGEPLVVAHVGVGDWDYLGSDDVVVYIRKSIYDKLVAGEYKVRKNQVKLVVEDLNGNVVQPYHEDGTLVY
jgi:hypothetical protein